MTGKYYYFIEDLDITSDKTPDGILIRQCKINIEKKKIFYTKNNYVSFEKLKDIITDCYEPKIITSKKTKKGEKHYTKTIVHNKNKLILMSAKTINEIKNNKLDFKRLPRIIISKKTHFNKHFNSNSYIINNNKLLKNINNLFSNK
jgi:ribosomal protein L7Ae-like RNA K-turn-binding protein